MRDVWMPSSALAFSDLRKRLIVLGIKERDGSFDVIFDRNASNVSMELLYSRQHFSTENQKY